MAGITTTSILLKECSTWTSLAATAPRKRTSLPWCAAPTPWPPIAISVIIGQMHIPTSPIAIPSSITSNHARWAKSRLRLGLPKQSASGLPSWWNLPSTTRMFLCRSLRSTSSKPTRLSKRLSSRFMISVRKTCLKLSNFCLLNIHRPTMVVIPRVQLVPYSAVSIWPKSVGLMQLINIVQSSTRANMRLTGAMALIAMKNSSGMEERTARNNYFSSMVPRASTHGHATFISRLRHMVVGISSQSITNWSRIISVAMALASKSRPSMIRLTPMPIATFVSTLRYSFLP